MASLFLLCLLLLSFFIFFSFSFSFFFFTWKEGEIGYLPNSRVICPLMEAYPLYPLKTNSSAYLWLWHLYSYISECTFNALKVISTNHISLSRFLLPTINPASKFHTRGLYCVLSSFSCNVRSSLLNTLKYICHVSFKDSSFCKIEMFLDYGQCPEHLV